MALLLAASAGLPPGGALSPAAAREPVAALAPAPDRSAVPPPPTTAQQPITGSPAGSPALPLPAPVAVPAIPVTPVAAVDLQRYAGFWYEIARVPAWFQNQCARRSIARYALRPDGRIAVLNQCIKRNGNVQQAEGIARVVDPASKAQLQVSLVNLLGWRPFWGDYWVIGLDPAYRWAVVGTPDRRFGWILARSPALEPGTLETILQIVERNGYRRSSFVLTPQSP